MYVGEALPMSEPKLSSSTMQDRRAQPTIHDVARVAGVSISTVSKVLNDQGRLRPETRARVREVAEQLGFRPNDLAQSLLRGRTFTVGLLTTDSYGRFSLPILAGIEDALGPTRMSVFLSCANDDVAREQQHIEALLAKKVDGIIVTSRRIDPRAPVRVGNTGTPVIYALTQVLDPTALCLLPDETQGVRLAIEHLLAGGRRHFAHITGPGRFKSVRVRERATRAVLADHGVVLPDQHVLSGTWHEHWGYDAANLLLDTNREIDAIFCGNDLIARGVADRLRERGVRVPDDIAIVGFDNWEIIAEGTRPPLTSVDQNLRALGHLAASKLLTRINGAHETGILYQPCELVVRQSSGSAHPPASS